MSVTSNYLKLGDAQFLVDAVEGDTPCIQIDQPLQYDVRNRPFPPEYNYNNSVRLLNIILDYLDKHNIYVKTEEGEYFTNRTKHSPSVRIQGETKFIGQFERNKEPFECSTEKMLELVQELFRDIMPRHIKENLTFEKTLDILEDYVDSVEAELPMNLPSRAALEIRCRPCSIPGKKVTRKDILYATGEMPGDNEPPKIKDNYSRYHDAILSKLEALPDNFPLTFNKGNLASRLAGDILQLYPTGDASSSSKSQSDIRINITNMFTSDLAIFFNKKKDPRL